MPAEKTISISFRVTLEFKDLLAVAASRTNLIERLLFDRCRQLGVRGREVTKQGTR